MKISHLLYTDYLKLITKSEEEFQKQIQTVKTFSDDIHMEFELEKCAKIIFRRGKAIQSQNLVVDITREIQELEKGKTYKYLGIEEMEEHTTPANERETATEYRSGLRMILKSELNAKNKITAIGKLAVPVLRYSFGIINWRIEEIKQTDRKIERC